MPQDYMIFDVSVSEGVTVTASNVYGRVIVANSFDAHGAAVRGSDSTTNLFGDVISVAVNRGDSDLFNVQVGLCHLIRPHWQDVSVGGRSRWFCTSEAFNCSFGVLLGIGSTHIVDWRESKRGVLFVGLFEARKGLAYPGQTDWSFLSGCQEELLRLVHGAGIL